MKEARQVERALSVIEEYKGDVPLHHFLRSFFQRHPEMGSRDRKTCSNLIYSWFRLGKSLSQLEQKERLACAVYLSLDDLNDTLLFLIKEYSGINPEPGALDSKIENVKKCYHFSEADLFPFDEELSEGISKLQYSRSMLLQPYTWLRVPLNAADKVHSVLKKNNISFKKEENRYGLQSGINLEAIGLNKDWYEVQDRSSQLTGQLYYPKSGESWYDCCAASGGKSLLLHDIQPDIQITVSDNRQSILKNLTQRFLKNKIRNYKSFVLDIEVSKPPFDDEIFDGIIADVPCSGSGTWSRTPEQLTFFKPDSLNIYIERQKRILSNVNSLLKEGSPLIYSTCSVFKSENEDLVKFICDHLGFVCQEKKVFNGIDSRSDTMFVARLIKQ